MARYIMKNIVVYTIIVFVFLALIGVIIQMQNTEPEYDFPEPPKVVEQYFASWSKGDWPNMYSTISDGFKKIEQTAGSLADFIEYAESQGIVGVNIISIEEKSNDGNTSIVDYSVEFVSTDGSKRSFNGSFTLKNRKTDLVRGWKLIHPYGDNIDTS